MASFPFTFEVNAYDKVNDREVTGAQIEFRAVLAHNEPDHTDWQIVSIVMEGWGGEAELSKDHYLYAPILTYLLNQKRGEIDEAWDEAVAEAAALKEVV